MSATLRTHDEHRSIVVRTRSAVLDADLALPHDAHGLVLFAHGSGSSRKSPRNRQVAARLHHAGFATLLLDLLTGDEEASDAATGTHRFDVGMLAVRLVDATDQMQGDPELARLPFGYFGASTGAAAALVAAALRPKLIRAVVSRGGRPDLAGRYLGAVAAPTLLIVGGADTTVLALNRWALDRLGCPKDLVVVPGATHLFEERGALERVEAEAVRWFEAHLPSPHDLIVPHREIW